MSPSKRIVANVLASYGRLCVWGIAGLISTPMALQIVGASDYGIFAVVGGSLAFFMVINTALASSAQRHIAYALGERNQADARKWFTASLVVHIVVGISIGAVALGASHWLLLHALTIPPGRMAAAAWVYRMVVAAMVCNLFSTPFQAVLMAHEEILWLSLLSCLSALFLIAGSLVLRGLPGDPLLWYSAIYSFSQILMVGSPVLYCLVRFEECRRFEREGIQGKTVAALLSFSGWNLFGVLAYITRIQGPALLLNMFSGTVANSAYGVATQVNAFASNISGGVLRVTTPPIVKREAAADREGVRFLSNASNTYAFGILWIAVAPLIAEFSFCLKVWLHHAPADTGTYMRLLLVALLIDQLSSGFMAPLQAKGHIAQYQVVVGALNCVGVPVAYLLLRMGLPPSSILWPVVGGTILAGCGRLWFAHNRANIPVHSWLRSVLLPCSICAALSSGTILATMRLLHEGLIRFIAVVLLNGVTSAYVMWRFGTPSQQKSTLKAMLLNIVAPACGTTKNLRPRSIPEL
jgi:O-antigen/teichoic acid export membrane protein